mgnify:FL=1
MSNHKTAHWSISLDAECPECFEDVDLLDDPEFWDDRDLGVGEHNTPRSKGVCVHCPACGQLFYVDLEY